MGPWYLKGENRTWSHRSVAALMREATAGEEPEDVIRRKANDLITDATKIGWEGPPFNPEILAGLRGITLMEAKCGLKAEARIFPIQAGKPCIEYDPAKPKGRVRFSICHEIAHTFFPDCYETAHHRQHQTGDDVELLCDLAAAELLMPRDSFAQDLQSCGTTLAGVRLLKGKYVASGEAVLIRVSQLTNESCAVVFLSEKLKPVQQRVASTMEFDLGLPPPKLKLRVDYVKPSRTFGVYVPKDKSAPDDSVAYRCLQSGDVEEAVENWEISKAGPWRVQASPLPSFPPASPQRVAVLVFAQ